MKTKLLVYVTIAAISLSFFACSNKPTNEKNIKSTANTEVSIDSLELVWDIAWNNHNLDALIGMISENSIVFENEWQAVGKDSVVENFLKVQLPVHKKLTTTKILDGSSEGMVYRVGEWSLDYLKKDSTTATQKGVFTIIWKKQADNNWKVEVLQTGSIN